MHCTLPLKFLNHSLNENSSVGNGLINLKKLKITDMQVADQLQGPPKAFQPLHNFETTFKNASNLPCSLSSICGRTSPRGGTSDKRENKVMCDKKHLKRTLELSF